MDVRARICVACSTSSWGTIRSILLNPDQSQFIALTFAPKSWVRIPSLFRAAAFNSASYSAEYCAIRTIFDSGMD